MKIKNFKDYMKLLDTITESRYYSAYDSDDDILPKHILDTIKDKLSIKRWKRLSSGKFGTAFKISNTKVLKISKDMKEYEYAKKLIGLKNEHIADIYDVKYLNYENENYAIIIKEYCIMDESYTDNLIDKFLDYTANEMSLSYLSSEFLYGTESKSTFDTFFRTFKNNKGSLDGFYEDWYNMIMELKKHKIYVKDFNGANIGVKRNGKFGIIELGLGYYDKIKLDKSDLIEI